MMSIVRILVLLGLGYGLLVALVWLFQDRLLHLPSTPGRELVAALKRPVLVVHGRDDEVIPFHHGRAVYAAADEPRRFLELSGGHNTAFPANRRRYAETLDSFLTEEAGL